MKYYFFLTHGIYHFCYHHFVTKAYCRTASVGYSHNLRSMSIQNLSWMLIFTNCYHLSDCYSHNLRSMSSIPNLPWSTIHCLHVNTCYHLSDCLPPQNGKGSIDSYYNIHFVGTDARYFLCVVTLITEQRRQKAYRDWQYKMW